MRWMRGLMAWKFMPETVICWISFCARPPTSVRMAMAAARKSARVCCWRCWTPCARQSARDRVGLRLSPVTSFNDISDDHPQDTFEYVVGQLNPFRLAFLDILQGTGGAPREAWLPFDYDRLRERYTGNLIRNNGYDFETAQEAVTSGAADAIAFGRLLLANPDLVERFRRGAALNAPDYDRLYSGEEKGYTDYPVLQD